MQTEHPHDAISAIFQSIRNLSIHLPCFEKHIINPNASTNKKKKTFVENECFYIFSTDMPSVVARACAEKSETHLDFVVRVLVLLAGRQIGNVCKSISCLRRVLAPPAAQKQYLGLMRDESDDRSYEVEVFLGPPKINFVITCFGELWLVCQLWIKFWFGEPNSDSIQTFKSSLAPIRLLMMIIAHLKTWQPINSHHQ